MKKIDLHIHTVPTISDAHFTYSLSKLSEYVKLSKLDAIAITNHDIFDYDQFKEIENQLECKVFPGIEIKLEKCHILLISENEELSDFRYKTQEVSNKIQTSSDFISVEELINIFDDLSKYLLIPHYDKNPSISSNTLEKIKKYVSAGEVNSPKKFIRVVKNSEELTPVLFSDIRISENLNNFPTRHTFVNCGELTIKSLKHSFRDRSKVALSNSDGNSLFQVFDDGQKLSTGLNIILGPRSSGKTVTLKKINEEQENVKYIPQFSLVQIEEKSYEKQFNDDITRKKSLFSEKHLSSFKSVLDEVIGIDLDANRRKVQDYLDTLLKSAQETEKFDTFSKVSLFNESEFELDDDKLLHDLISSVRQLIENIEFKEIIEKHLTNENLKALACELIIVLRNRFYENKKKKIVNETLKDIKNKLHMRTSATQIKDFDLYKVLIDHKKTKKFEQITKSLQTEKVILEESLQGYKVVCKQRPFNGPGEVKAVSGLRVGFSEIFQYYSNPIKYLKQLKLNESLTASEFYRYFTCIEYEILNKDGFNVSGGERSEFRLLQEIQDAQNYDYLLIDEPESSFDNIFLKDGVNQILKELSKTMPVVIVTHNSTVGASINPDYIIFTSKEFEDDNIVYRRYSGYPSDKELYSPEGAKCSNFKVTINSLEAGEDAYHVRRSGYESIKN